MKRSGIKIKLLLAGILSLTVSNSYLSASEIESVQTSNYFTSSYLEAYSADEYFRLRGIGNKIAAASKVDVRILVTKESKADACVYPDGTIVLTEGLVNLSEDDSEIAFVIAHEVGHITMGHYKQEIVYSMLDDLYLPERAKEEAEADLHGAVFMQMAGYYTRAAVNFLIKMLETRTDTSAYFSERIDTLNHFISQYNSELEPDHQ